MCKGEPRRLGELMDGAVTGRWAAAENLAAEDEYVCHDETPCDDYRMMTGCKMVDSIRDHGILQISHAPRDIKRA